MADTTNKFTRSKLLRQRIHYAVRVASEKGTLATLALVEHCLLECVELLGSHCLA